MAGLALLAAAAFTGSLALKAFDRANPWFLGALVVSMGFTIAGIHLSAIPVWMSNAAQLLIGVSLGTRFTSQFLHTAPRWRNIGGLGNPGDDRPLLCACPVGRWRGPRACIRPR